MNNIRATNATRSETPSTRPSIRARFALLSPLLDVWDSEKGGRDGLLATSPGTGGPKLGEGAGGGPRGGGGDENGGRGKNGALKARSAREAETESIRDEKQIGPASNLISTCLDILYTDMKTRKVMK